VLHASAPAVKRPWSPPMQHRVIALSNSTGLISAILVNISHATMQCYDRHHALLRQRTSSAELDELELLSEDWRLLCGLLLSAIIYDCCYCLLYIYDCCCCLLYL
jgi:hypothetical protein